MKTPRSTTTLELETQLYPVEAVQAAAYAFGDRLEVALKKRGGTVAATLRPKRALSRKAFEELAGEFRTELLHQSLRSRVSEANREARDFIVTRALASAQTGGELPPVGSAFDQKLEEQIEGLLKTVEKFSGQADPLGICKPWEEQHKAEAGDKA